MASHLLRRLAAGLCSSFALTLAVQAAEAVPTPQQQDAIQRQQDLFLQQERLRREDLLKRQDPSRQMPGQVTVTPVPQPAPDARPSQCFDIQQIQLQGAVHLALPDRERLLKPFLGNCLGLADIRELMRLLTNHYVEQGYVTTRIYIPQQDMSKGSLSLLVVEGTVGQIKLDGDGTRINPGMVFPGLAGEVLNIRDIEQGLDQINRLGSNNATMTLMPGDDPGITNILVSNQPRAPWYAGLTWDNYGSPSTGDKRVTLNVGLDAPLGLQEAWFASFSRNTDAFRDRRLSESAMLSLNVPYGYWNFNGTASRSQYVSQVKTAAQTFVSSGNTNTYSLGVQRVLQRGQTNKTTLNTSLNHKISKNFIEGSLLETGSPRLTDLSLSLTSVFMALNGSWTTDVGVAQGLKWFGVESLPGAGTGTVPTSTGTRYFASASYGTGWRVGERAINWSSSLQAQYSNHYLYGSEQMSVGGLFTVRGFDGTSLSGDRGMYWRNEFSTVLDAPALERVVGRLQAYVAADVGRIVGREGQRDGNLGGIALGLRAGGSAMTLDVAVATPFHTSRWVRQPYDVDKPALYLKVGFAL